MSTADNQSAQAEDEGLEPTKEWVTDLIDEIIAEEFASPDLELAWLDEDEADPKGMEAVLARSRLASDTSMPPYLAFQLYRVASEIPCLRASSPVFAPASCSRSTAMICSSVNLPRFIVRPSVRAGL